MPRQRDIHIAHQELFVRLDGSQRNNLEIHAPAREDDGAVGNAGMIEERSCRAGRYTDGRY